MTFGDPFQDSGVVCPHDNAFCMVYGSEQDDAQPNAPAKSRIPNFESRIPRPETRNPNTEYRILNPESRIPNPHTRNPRPEYRIPKPSALNSEPQTLNPESQTASSEPQSRRSSDRRSRTLACKFGTIKTVTAYIRKSSMDKKVTARFWPGLEPF